MGKISRKSFLPIFILVCLIGNTFSVQAAPQTRENSPGSVEVIPAEHSDISAPLSSFAKKVSALEPSQQKKPVSGRSNFTVLNPLGHLNGILGAKGSPLVATTDNLNFAGVGDGVSCLPEAQYIGGG